ncbi:hypothetical protein AB4396_06915 [Vibrio cyclitrophicus]
MTERAVTVEEMKEAVTLVYKECNGNLPLKFKIRNNAEEIYDAKTIEQHPELRSYQGAYFPRDGRVEFVCSRIISSAGGIGQSEGAIEQDKIGEGRGRAIEAAITVVRHEVLGHYALNTCSAEQKQNILGTIVKNKNEPTIQSEWEGVEKDYSNRTAMQKAEEVFSFVAENKPALDVSFNLSSEPFTIKHIEQIAARIAEGIRLGERIQQIFPANNHAQFYQSRETESQLSTHYQWSKADMKMIVTINGESPQNINIETLAKIASKDKFLSCYSLNDVRSGKLDLSMANGVQPVPKVYDSQGSPVIEQASIQPLKLK